MKLKIFCSIVILGFIWPTALNAQETLVLTAGENHPLTSLTQNILTEAYRRIGIGIKTSILPSQRSLAMANAGVFDGRLFLGAVNPNISPNLIRIPVVLTYGEIVVFTKHVKFKVNDWKSLCPYRIGIIKGINELEIGTMGMNVEKVIQPEQLFNMLVRDRVDIVVIPHDVGLKALNDMNLKGIIILEPPLQRDALYHYLHKKNKPLVPKITAALREMEKEGLIQAFNDQNVP